jgi:hypothetical protein
MQVDPRIEYDDLKKHVGPIIFHTVLHIDYLE